MDEIDFVLDGKRYQLSRDVVIRSMKRQIPGRIQTYAVDVDGVRFPVKQVLAQALQIPVTSFVSTRAQDLLSKLRFEVVNVETAETTDAGAATGARPLALQLAVQLLAGRPDVGPSDALASASAFARWLAEPAGHVVNARRGTAHGV